MSAACTSCDGRGWVVVERPDGTPGAKECACKRVRRSVGLVTAARIPERYQHCTLDDYEPNYKGLNKSLAAAVLQARNYACGYPEDTGGHGLLFTGSIGTGKTHLAVGILRYLIAKRGVRGLFWDYGELLDAVKHTYNDTVATTEHQVLQPVYDAEVLVLDELGAQRPTEWVGEKVAQVLNRRYNDKRITIITTNYPNKGPAAGGKEETLADRIGERMRSRLQEMCVVVELKGDDFRQGVKRARFNP